MATIFLTKVQLAAVLVCTRRTLTNYVRAGALPEPTRYGRDVGWPAHVLVEVSASGRLSKMGLTDDQRQRLLRVLDGADECSRLAADVPTECAGRHADVRQRLLPEPILVDHSLCSERDLRPSVIEKMKSNRRVMDLVGSQARQAPKRSSEKDDLYRELNFHREIADREEMFIANNFLPGHVRSQLVGSRDIFSLPIFNIRNKQSPRESRIQLRMSLTDGTVLFYEGPELRQDDSLVFMSLLNIARDVRLGKKVGFSPLELCQSLYGYYDGSSRARLKTMICRLQEAILHFPTFRVQLVQRFDFSPRGPWSVTLDTDIVQLLTKKSVVWLDFDQRLSLSGGLASWLYGYVRSQTWLMPMKVQRLHQLTGSDGALDGFRVGLKSAVALLASARLLEPGWHIDKHDQLHWLKVPG